MRFTVNGATDGSNNIRIDGASQYNIWLPHVTAYVPALESIETVNIVTNSFDAEQGLAAGAAVNVQIKSGTNDMHGSAFEYHQDNALKAKPFFSPQGARKPKLVYNQFGATFGGPIKKDKLFYFASYEGTTDRQFASRFFTVPTMAMRRGDMSASDRPIYDPDTGTSLPELAGQPSRETSFPTTGLIRLLGRSSACCRRQRMRVTPTTSMAKAVSLLPGIPSTPRLTGMRPRSSRCTAASVS